MRKVLDGEWGELKKIVQLRKEERRKRKGDCTSVGLGMMKLLGYCENRICLQVSIIGFEDTKRKTSTLVEECILNCCSIENISGHCRRF